MLSFLKNFLSATMVFLLTTCYLVFALEVQETEIGLDLKIDDKKTISLAGKQDGIRHKKVALFNISIYNAKLFFLPEISKISDLDSLVDAYPKAIRVNPMRSFGGDKLKEAMMVSYEVNNVDTNSEAQIEFLELISQHKIEKNNPFYLIGFKNKEGDELHLIIKDMNKVIRGHSGFLKEVFSVWLGAPVDADMTKLQEILIK